MQVRAHVGKVVDADIEAARHATRERIAEGIINAAKTVKLSMPLVVRLEGTNVERGKQLLKESGIELIAADDLADAAQKAVKAAGAAGSKSQNPNPK